MVAFILTTSENREFQVLCLSGARYFDETRVKKYRALIQIFCIKDSKKSRPPDSQPDLFSLIFLTHSRGFFLLHKIFPPDSLNYHPDCEAVRTNPNRPGDHPSDPRPQFSTDPYNTFSSQLCFRYYPTSSLNFF